MLWESSSVAAVLARSPFVENFLSVALFEYLFMTNCRLGTFLFKKAVVQTCLLAECFYVLNGIRNHSATNGLKYRDFDGIRSGKKQKIIDLRRVASIYEIKSQKINVLPERCAFTHGFACICTRVNKKN